MVSCLRALILYINQVRLIAGLKTLLKVSIMDCLKKRAFRILSFLLGLAPLPGKLLERKPQRVRLLIGAYKLLKSKQQVTEQV